MIYFKNLFFCILRKLYKPGPFDELSKELEEYNKLNDSKYKFILLSYIHMKFSNGFAIARVYGNSLDYKFNDNQMQHHLKLSKDYKEKAENFK
jgi:hypothetical protein